MSQIRPTPHVVSQSAGLVWVRVWVCPPPPRLGLCPGPDRTGSGHRAGALPPLKTLCDATPPGRHSLADRARFGASQRGTGPPPPPPDAAQIFIIHRWSRRPRFSNCPTRSGSKGVRSRRKIAAGRRAGDPLRRGRGRDFISHRRPSVCGDGRRQVTPSRDRAQHNRQRLETLGQDFLHSPRFSKIFVTDVCAFNRMHTNDRVPLPSSLGADNPAVRIHWT